MVPRTGWLAVALASLASVACGTDVDLLAQSVVDAGSDGPPTFLDVMAAEPCMPGAYRGSFQANRGFLALQGKITVTLTRSATSEIFTVDRTSTLTTPPLDNGATLKATVIGDGSCRTGDFAARLEDGLYDWAGDAQPDVPFTGNVSGTYRVTPRGPVLVGEWEAFLETSPPDQPISAGTWMAVLLVDGVEE